ncbi:unnamed protein product [Chilo suppressalis]|uniref:BED-type domain-containing protein n=1 Tax=Chilo suppressalis TaxID=168631 RepID=A0ABN8B0X6_CHISP|nr:unnamed protein product [Chilo suppressalis]
MGRPKNQKIWEYYQEINDKTIKCRFCEIVYKQKHVVKMTRHLLVCTKTPLLVKKQLKNDSNEQSCSQTSVTKGKNESSSLTKLFAKALFISGAPMSMVQHPLWRAFYEKLNFKLPSRKTLATKYLDTLYNEMFKELCDDLKKATFLHLQCDGWSNIRNQGVINFLISKPEMVFVKSLDTEDHRHTSEYLCSEIEKVMKSYGEQKFVVLIGDNARNLQKAFQMLQIKYPSIVPLGCAAHSLNLLCADAMKLHVIKACIDLATDVIKCVKRSQVLSALLFKIRKDKNIHGETLKLPCKTRWGSYVSALKSVETNKVALQTLAVNEHIQPSTEIKATILDENFWIMVNQCVNVLKPITESIFQLEGNDYNINKVFMVLKNIKSKLQFNLATTSVLENADKELLMTAVENRIAQVIKPIHLAAHLLDPIAVGQELDQNQEIDAMEFINDLANSLNIDCVADLAQYKGRGGLWSKQFTWKAAESVDPVMWWRGICGSTALSKIAVRILTAPCTSAATERSFSTHSFIHSVKRNRLTTERAAKISFLVYNWNLLYRDCVLDDHASSDGDIYVEHTSDEETDVDTSNETTNEPQASTSTSEQLNLSQ